MEYDEGCLARLEEVKIEMLELLGEAEELVKGTSEEDRAGAYWLSHIKGALTNESGIVGGSMYTMEDAIEGIRTNDLDITEEKVDCETDQDVARRIGRKMAECVIRR